MSEEPKPLDGAPSEWARKRAAGKARRARQAERRETYFDLLVSGYSVEQIAGAMAMSPSAVRRAVGQALDERRPDGPETFARLQIARLNKALRCADVSLEEGKLEAVAPYLATVAALNAFHGLGPAAPVRLRPPALAGAIPRRPAPPALIYAPREVSADGPAPPESPESGAAPEAREEAGFECGAPAVEGAA